MIVDSPPLTPGSWRSRHINDISGPLEAKLSRNLGDDAKDFHVISLQQFESTLMFNNCVIIKYNAISCLFDLFANSLLDLDFRL